MKPLHSRHVFALFFFFLQSAAPAQQFTVKNPVFSSKENDLITLQAVRLNPDSLILDLGYYGSASMDNPGFYVNNTSNLVFKYGGDRIHSNWISKVSSLVNAKYSDITYVKKNSTHNFSVIFPFSVYKLFADAKMGDIATFFSVGDPLTVSFVNCDKNYRQRYDLSFGNCFDIYQIKLDLPMQQWITLWCSGFLDRYLVKDEFETSAKYKSRVSPDSVKTALAEEITTAENYFAFSYYNSIQNKIPQINYDSDNETFAITYPGADKITIQMPIADAPSFKQRILDGKLELTDGTMMSMLNGVYYISTLTYTDKSTAGEIKVRNKTRQQTDPWVQMEDEVIKLLKKNYTKYNGF